MFSKTTKTVVAALLMISTLALAAAPAAAEMTGNETEFHNETVEITNNTTDIEVTINGTNGSDVFVNYYRIDDTGSETLESENLVLSSSGQNATDTYAVQTNDTSQYRVVVHDDETGLATSDVGPISVTTLTTASSGGGGAFWLNDDGSYNKPIIAATAFLGLVLISRGGDD